MSIGRGLGALITPSGSGKMLSTKSTPAGAAADRIWQVPVSEITPDKAQPRRLFKEPELQELAESIKEHGVLQPLLVTELPDGGYQIVAGERRWRASTLAGMATVPVIVKKLEDRQRLEIAVIENVQRENLNLIEEAFAYKRLIEEFGLTQEEVARKVGKSRPVVANAVRLLGLPEVIQNALAAGTISNGQARALLALPSADEQIAMMHSMLGEKMTVRELEQEVRLKKGPGSVIRRDPNITYIEEQLRTKLGARVQVSEKNGKGTITINYHSKEELKDLIEKITE